MTSLFDPFFLARRALRAEIATMARETRGIVIDIGCGTAPYRDLFAQATYVGVETVAASRFGSAKHGASVLYDGRRLPLADGSVDAVFCSQVLEHVFEPGPFLAEIHRVLRPDGRLLLTVPFVWDEHEQPYDFARYSSFGLRHLLATAGFEVEVARRTLADAGLIMQLWLAYLHKVLRRADGTTLPGRLLLAALSLPANLLGMAAAAMLPASPDLYLDNAMIAIRRGAQGTA